MKDDELFNRAWPMAIVERVFTGSDGKVRVAELAAGGKSYKRDVTRLVVLLPQEEEGREGTGSFAEGGGCLGLQPDTLPEQSTPTVQATEVSRSSSTPKRGKALEMKDKGCEEQVASPTEDQTCGPPQDQQPGSSKDESSLPKKS